MKNITVSVSDKSYRDARVWSAQRDTSLSRIVQHLISTLPKIERAQQAFPIKTGSNAPEKANSATSGQ